MGPVRTNQCPKCKKKPSQCQCHLYPPVPASVLCPFCGKHKNKCVCKKLSG